MKEADSEQEKIFKLKSAVNSGAGWLGAIALFSIINSFLIASKSSLNFIIGLGITQVIDYLSLSKAPGGTGIRPGVGSVISILIAAIFLVFAHQARKRQRWAFITGIVVYSLDSIIIIAVGDYLSFGFHVFALIFISKGLIKLQELNKIEAGEEVIIRDRELIAMTAKYEDNTPVIICPNCNTEVKQIYHYCVHCGQELHK